MATKMRPYDAAEFLSDEETIEAYLASAFQDGDTAEIAMAIGNVAKARGMTSLAEKTGLSRESLYRSLSAEGNPAFSTVVKIIDAFGLQLGVHKKPAKETEAA